MSFISSFIFLEIMLSLLLTTLHHTVLFGNSYTTWQEFFLPLGATAQGELWPPE
jgi:hypothetical protein